PCGSDPCRALSSWCPLPTRTRDGSGLDPSGGADDPECAIGSDPQGLTPARQSTTATALISIRQRGSVASRTTCTVVGAGLASRKFAPPRRLGRVWRGGGGKEGAGGPPAGKGGAGAPRPAPNFSRPGAPSPRHVARHAVELLRPVRMVVIDRRRRDARQ